MEKQELELQHLAPYLPFRLKILNNQGEIGILSELNTDSVEQTTMYNVVHSYNSLDKVKPILRPLSDLTKEIEHNGEKFIPLLKIAEFLGIKYLRYEVLNNSIDFILDPSYSRPNTKTKEPIKSRFWYNSFKTKSFCCTRTMLYFDQFGAFQKLLEMHFDVFELIKKGLAVDFNTLNNN